MGTPEHRAALAKWAGLGTAGASLPVAVYVGGPWSWVLYVVAIAAAVVAWWGDRELRRTSSVTRLVAVLQQDPSVGYEGEVDEQGRPSLRFWGGKGRRRK
jgi:hypothetical protein